MAAPAPIDPISRAAKTPSSSTSFRVPRMSLGVILLLIAINILWGGSSLAAKVALGTPAHPGLPPMTLVFARFSCAALLMYLAAWRLKVDLRVARRDWSRLWLLGVLGLAITYLLGYLG